MKIKYAIKHELYRLSCRELNGACFLDFNFLKKSQRKIGRLKSAEGYRKPTDLPKRLHRKYSPEVLSFENEKGFSWAAEFLSSELSVTGTNS